MTHAFKYAIVCTLVSSLFRPVAWATDHSALQKQLRDAYEGKLLSLKTPCTSDRLHFDTSGKPLSALQEAPWTTSGVFRVESVAVKSDRIEIRGKRLILALRLDKTGTRLVPIELDRHLRIDLDIAPSMTDLQQTYVSLAQIFQGGKLEERISAYWKPTIDLGDLMTDRASLLQRLPDRMVGRLEGNRPVYLVSPPAVTPPKSVHTPDPDYSDGARKKRVTGTTTMRLILNEKGQPEILVLVKDLGEGLDIRALAAVSQWRFQPAVKDGQPVAALVTVEVNFDLY
jgi:TonB family protein